MNYKDKRDKFAIVDSGFHRLALSITPFRKSFIAVDWARVFQLEGASCNVVTKTHFHLDPTVSFNMGKVTGKFKHGLRLFPRQKTREYSKRCDIIIMPYKGTINLLVIPSSSQRATTTKMYFIRF